MRDEGIDVLVHDPAITSDTSIESQLSYVKHGSPGLAALADDQRGIQAQTADDVVNAAEAIIVTQCNDAYAELARTAAEQSDTPVIDVVRLFDECPNTQSYQGIGW